MPARAGSPQAELHERLLARKGEIEEAILTRVYAVSDPTASGDPTYLEGLRAAVSAAIDYGLEAVQSSQRSPPPIPPVLLVQARIAARSEVSLDTVLRRYFAGYALLGDFLIEEAEGRDLQGAALKRLLRAQASIFDRLLAAIGEEHAREEKGRIDTAEERRAELVGRLLAGERLDASELAYDLEGVHLGLVAQGPGAGDALRELATALDRRLLLVGRGEPTVWAWLGSGRDIDREEVSRTLGPIFPQGAHLAIGEPAQGVAGWRLTHRQARAALPVALRSPEPLIRYADVALLASMLQDDLLATSLRRIYLDPLAQERDGGGALRETLRAYFAADRNMSSAASALGVSRQTINRHLHTIEQRLGRPLRACAVELEAILRLGQLSDPAVEADRSKQCRNMSHPTGEMCQIDKATEPLR